MRCDRIQLLLSEYIDGELSSAAVLGVQAHLKQCPACEAEHQALRRTVQLVALYGRQEAPIDCRDAVMAQLRDIPAPAAPMAWPSLAELFPFRAPLMPTWARAAAVAGLTAVTLTAGTFMFQRTQAPMAATSPVQLVQDDRARLYESSQLLQALGRDDGYILAADFVDWNP
jgi:anti-sigma factor RsiW